MGSLSYERYKTINSHIVCIIEFENLVSYERYKTDAAKNSWIAMFENLVSYERYKTIKRSTFFIRFV